MKNNENSNFAIGKNSVFEALKSESEINFIMASCKVPDNIFDLSKKRKIIIKKCDSRKLDKMFGGVNHQGIVAQISPKKYCSIEYILEVSRKRNEKTFILILDRIQDPHNFGAIIRTAECMGVHGIIISKREAVSITPTVERCSCGASQYVNIARVSNISNSIKKLKENNIWIIGTDSNGESFYKSNDIFNRDIALVIGSEGKGISRSVLKMCDEVLSIPLRGKINSLNASVASSIFMMKVSETRYIANQNKNK